MIWAPYINLLSNCIAAGGEILATWRGVEIITISKKGDVAIPSNYRPISLIDNLQKIFARQVLDKLQDWMDDNVILSLYQAGFHPKISTCDQPFRFTLLIWKYVLLRKLYVAFVDLRAAFDLVPHDLLWKTMLDLGAPVDLVTLIAKLHKDSYAQVRWGKMEN